MARRQKPSTGVPARKAKKVPVALPPESAPDHWLRSIRLSGFTLVVLTIVILAVIVLAPSLRVLVEQQNAIDQIQRELIESRDAVEELERDVARWEDPAYVEAQARERLYLVYPGELSYLVIDDVGVRTPAASAPISDEIQTTKVDWVHGLVSSLFTAGLTDAPPEELAPVIEGQ